MRFLGSRLTSAMIVSESHVHAKHAVNKVTNCRFPWNLLALNVLSLIQNQLRMHS